MIIGKFIIAINAKKDLTNNMKITLLEQRLHQINSALLQRGARADIELIKEIKYQMYKIQSINEFKENMERLNYKI